VQHQASTASRWIRREKKRLRSVEQLRPDVIAKRKAFWRLIRRIPARRLVFLDESGLNAAMTRSHAWVKRGCEFVERTPMNWGGNLTLLGAMRVTGWVLLSTMFASTNRKRFVRWLRGRLLPRLRRGDVLVLDNLSAHHDARVESLCAAFGVRVVYLPPYSHDFNPIELGWALQKQYVRKHAPRDRAALRRVARRARYRVTSHHCRQWFAHSGYQVQHK
jgi:transposase